MIVNDPFEPLPADTNMNLHLLLNAILNKDDNRRPHINDLARIPCLKKSILKFIEDHNLNSEVIGILSILIDENKDDSNIIDPDSTTSNSIIGVPEF